MKCPVSKPTYAEDSLLHCPFLDVSESPYFSSSSLFFLGFCSLYDSGDLTPLSCL